MSNFKNVAQSLEDRKEEKSGYFINTIWVGKDFQYLRVFSSKGRMEWEAGGGIGDAVLGYRGEARADREGEAVDLPAELHSCPHLWPRAVGRDRKGEIAECPDPLTDRWHNLFANTFKIFNFRLFNVHVDPAYHSLSPILSDFSIISPNYHELFFYRTRRTNLLSCVCSVVASRTFSSSSLTSLFLLQWRRSLKQQTTTKTV